MNKEEWRPVVGYKGIYEVSNLGRIRSTDRVDNTGRNLIGRTLKPYLSSNGYFYVSLSRSGRTETIVIHRAMASSFLRERKSFEVVDHIDGNRSNNNLNNLQIITTRENTVRGRACLDYKGKNSKYAGVHRTPKGRWVSRKTIGSTKHYMGTFDTEEEAYEAYLNFKEPIK